MARKRIELPSADELFGDRKPAQPPHGASRPRKTAPRSTSAAPKQGTPRGSLKKPSAKKAAPKTKKPATAKRPTTARRAATTAPARNGHGATAESRLSALESRLATLPVDALIDLRDGLEELLAAEVVDEAAVRGLLDSLDA